MRSIPLMAVSTIVLATAWACGGDGGNVEPNTPPVAAFTAPTTCTVNTPCPFSDASTDDHGIASREWDFGDGSAKVTDASTTHSFAEAKDYIVTLKVTDASGETNSVSHTVTVGTGTPNNLAPVANFIAPTGCTVNSACPFSDASTDSDGNVTTWAWNFGDGSAVDPNPSTNHTFTAEGDYQVQLTVTDNLGATNSITQQVTISAPSASQCTTVSTSEVDCALGIAARSTITLSLTSVDCELGGNLVLIPPPGLDMAQNVFSNVCDVPDQAPKTLTTEAGAPLVFEAGSTLHVRLRRGTGTPTPGSPAGHVTPGTAPASFTLNFDDGGNPGGDGEPDFGDVVVTVQANAAL
jgi:PKD repeat protein